MSIHLGISHLAFKNSTELQNLTDDIRRSGITNLELVFAKCSNHTINTNLNIESTQSILHQTGVKDMLDDIMFETITNISDQCSTYGIKLLVLGSPSQRLVLDYDKLLYQFTRIDDYLRQKNQTLCIEPNSKEYGGKYFYTVSEIVNFLNHGMFTNIKTMIDTHNLILEGEDILSTFEKYYDYIKHIHVSEYKLKSFTPTKLHVDFSKLIKSSKYNGIITNETLTPENLLDEIKLFTGIYGY